MKKDLEQAWCNFAGWRVNYDRVLLALAGLTMAPPRRGPATAPAAFSSPRIRATTQ